MINNHGSLILQLVRQASSENPAKSSQTLTDKNLALSIRPLGCR